MSEVNKPSIAVFWHRRDLRLEDNAGLYQTLLSGLPVVPIFIFDRHILDKLEDRADKRVLFIHQNLQLLKDKLQASGKDLYVYYGFPEEIWPKILQTWDVKAVYFNHDYEPYARERDSQISDLLEKSGVAVHSFKDHTIFEKDEVLSNEGKAYTVFTPYSRKWKQRLQDHPLTLSPSENKLDSLFKLAPEPLISLEAMGFASSEASFPEKSVTEELLRQYGEKRNYPSLPATSRLSVHLRFGTVSVRSLALKGLQHSETWLNELIWRDFYFNIVWHFPHVAKGSFRPIYDRIPWRNDEKEFKAWCEGNTGYPIVDAGMRELNTTGFMHNRVRMITASFLTKHLLIDWRWGEAYFASKLLDFDLSANNGGWQWASGSGTDAAPYFRIFNPAEQTKKFDPKGEYIRKWVPEFNSLNYAQPIVEHSFARKRCLEVYKSALG